MSMTTGPHRRVAVIRRISVAFVGKRKTIALCIKNALQKLLNVRRELVLLVCEFHPVIAQMHHGGCGVFAAVGSLFTKEFRTIHVIPCTKSSSPSPHVHRWLM